MSEASTVKVHGIHEAIFNIQTAALQIEKSETGGEAGSKVKWKFASLATILRQLRPLLAENGVYLVSGVENGEHGSLFFVEAVHVQTQERVRSSVPMITSEDLVRFLLVIPDDASNKYGDNARASAVNRVSLFMEQGKVITYLRRYCIHCLFNLCPGEETDNEEFKPYFDQRREGDRRPQQRTDRRPNGAPPPRRETPTEQRERSQREPPSDTRDEPELVRVNRLVTAARTRVQAGHKFQEKEVVFLKQMATRTADAAPLSDKQWAYLRALAGEEVKTAERFTDTSSGRPATEDDDWWKQAKERF